MADEDLFDEQEQFSEEESENEDSTVVDDEVAPASQQRSRVKIRRQLEEHLEKLRLEKLLGDNYNDTDDS